MNNPQTIYKLTALLFTLAALVTVLAHFHAWEMSAVWLALSAVFFALSQQAKSRP